MKKTNKIISFVLALSMFFTTVPISALDFNNTPEIISSETTDSQTTDSELNTPEIISENTESSESTESTESTEPDSNSEIISEENETTEENNPQIVDSETTEEETSENSTETTESSEESTVINSETTEENVLPNNKPNLVQKLEENPVSINALENEGWTFSATMKSGQTTSNALTWNSEAPANATFTYEITYSRPAISDDDTAKIYEPGDITIEITSPIYQIVRELNGCLPASAYNTTVSIGSGSGEDEDWKSTRYVVTNTNLTTRYVITNTKQINPTQALAGTIQVTVTLNSRYVKSPSTASVVAKLTTKSGTSISSDPMTLSFTSTRAPYSVTVAPNTVYAGSSTVLPDNKDDYYWVQFRTSYSLNSGNGVRESFKKNLTLDALPGIKVYNSTFQEISENNDSYLVKDNYPEEISTVGTENFNMPSEQVAVFYVAFPKSTYNTTTNITLRLNGIPIDETDRVEVANTTTSVNVTNFELNYEGDVFVIGSDSNLYHASKETMINGGASLKGSFIWGYNYDPEIGAVDLDCYQDVIFAQDANNAVYKMDDSEYEFNGFYYSYDYSSGDSYYGLYDPFTYEDLTGQYNTQLYVRYAGETDYVMLDEGTDIFTQSSYYSFDNKIPEGKSVVAYYFRICNADRPIRLKIDSYYTLYSDKVGDDANVWIFNTLIPYKHENGTEIKLEITEDNYTNTTSKQYLMTYDQDTYGKLMFRAFITVDTEISALDVSLRKAIGNINNVPASEYVSFNYNMKVLASQGSFYASPTNFQGFILMDLLPDGVEVTSTPEEIKNSLSINTSLKYENEKYGADLLKKENFLNYISVDIISNWNDTGRTLVKITLDTRGKENQIDTSPYFESGNHIIGTSYYLTTFIDNIIVKCKMNYDAFQEYGTTLENNFYLGDIDNNANKGYSFTLFDATGSYVDGSTTGKARDNGSYDADVKDLDGDGNTSEMFFFANRSDSLNVAIGSYTDFVKQVSDDLATFNTGKISVANGATYAYKLRARTGNNKAKNLVFFDSLENAGNGWKGTLAGFDTSYIESKGYKAVIYYAKTYDYSKDLSDPMWKPYSSSVPAANVKSIAVTFTMSDGSEIIYPENTLMYIKVLMTSPEDPNIKTFAKNEAYCEWTPVSVETGQELTEVTFDSNVVSVGLPNSVEGDGGPYVDITFSKEIVGTDEDFASLNLDKNDTFLFQITLTKQEANEDGTYTIVNGLLTNKTSLVFTGLTSGSWKVEETDDNYFDFVDFIASIPEGVTDITFNPDTHILTISEDIQADQEISIICRNEIEDDRTYEEKDEAENLFKVTAPSSTSDIHRHSGNSSN